VVFFAVAVPVAAFSALDPLTNLLPGVSASAYVTVLTGAVLAAFGLWCGRHRIVAALHTSVRAIPWLQARRHRFAQFLGELRIQMGTLLRGNAHRNFALLLLTALQWLTRYGVLGFVLVELGHRLPFGFVLVLQAVILHLAQWTGIPAGGGSAELALAAALGPWVSSSIMATVLLLWRFATLYLALIVGALSLAALTGA
jgi:uncharacterized membrane protein YbhN (UPF0104 family)